MKKSDNIPVILDTSTVTTFYIIKRDTSASVLSTEIRLVVVASPFTWRSITTHLISFDHQQTILAEKKSEKVISRFNHEITKPDDGMWMKYYIKLNTFICLAVNLMSSRSSSQ